jgi:hypothetical protein
MLIALKFPYLYFYYAYTMCVVETGVTWTLGRVLRVWLGCVEGEG